MRPPLLRVYSSPLPTLDESIQSNRNELGRLVKELEGCSHTIGKVGELHRNNFCRSATITYKEGGERNKKYKNEAIEALAKRLDAALKTVTSRVKSFKQQRSPEYPPNLPSELQNPPDATPSTDVEENGQSVYELLEIAYQNLYQAILANKQYDMILQDLSSSLDIEEKLVLTKAMELSRESKTFKKMTGDAIEQLRLSNVLSSSM